MSCFNSCSQKVDSTLSSGFYALGKRVGGNPWKTVAAALLLAVVLLYGLADFKQEGRQEELFNPKGIQAVEDRADYTQFFGESSVPGNVIFEPKLGSNVVTVTVLGGIFDYVNFVTQINVTESIDEGIAAFQDKCERFPFPPFDCIINSPFSAWDYNKTKFEQETDIASITQTLNNTFTREQLDGMFGGATYDGSGVIASANILSIFWLMKNEAIDRVIDGTNLRVDVELVELETNILDYTFAREDYKGFKNEEWRGVVEVYPRLIESFSEVVGGSILGDVPIQAASYVVIITYILFAVQDKSPHWHFAIGGLAVVSILMGIGGGIGLAQLLDIPYGNTHTILVFIILGLGADGCFILLSSFRRTDAGQQNDIRAAEACSHAGVSLTVTSLTNVTAFAIGSLTAIPDLSSFCKYAALSQFFLYVFQNTFFVACIVLNEQRIENNRLDCLCCFHGKEKETAKNSGPQGSTRLSRFLANEYAPLLLSNPCRIAVLVATVIIVGVFGYFVSTLTVEATGNNFIPDGTYLKENLDLTSKFFSGVPNDVDVVITDIDYFEKRAELLTLRAKFSQPGLETGPPYINADFSYWFEEFITDFQARTGLVPPAYNYDPSHVFDDTAVTGGFFPNNRTILEFYVKQWTQDIFGTDGFGTNPGAQFVGNVIFDTSDSIVRSSVSMQHFPIGEFDSSGVFQEDAEEVVKAVEKMNDICDSFTFEVYPTAFVYTTSWASYAIVLKELVQNVSLALLSVLIVTAILIGHPVTSGLVFLTVLLTILELLGAQTMIGYSIDTVVVVLTILAVGLSVDYAAHIGHCFMIKDGTREERIIASLEDIGAPVLNGALSTFLAVLFQAFSKSYVFRVVFFDFFCAVLFGCLNGLVLLPVLLSFVGPASYGRGGDSDAKVGSDYEMASPSM
mmetsp:Transcript_1584/g.2114  ORF Transcript_1584/g.2114 Transcript_1584/m.2114 type:complete len:909 (+) Transcript_1584:142-2868(+)|eukprot:CAMPEP_0204876066 /NCGR_PEP_ID=MMETSP1348-20121228/47426_1 /ASSEMBLY_ACC=CAM_ASM_000700 /TAXON_ID=215587 /ORGANISM="Aplanochytrium stocchinoi, Strain GSBS06" /LENGTH=908 /DNA_ID=CAMNT_0052032777 /DNA_START=57 /DNA_END=2783 /DNA_ORIENTATION=-